MKLKEKVDRLGVLRAEIADLKLEMEKIEQELKDKYDDATTLDGELFRLALFIQNRKNTDWKLICEKLGASNRIIKANTKVQDIKVIKLTARRAA